jgi:hypothetical protein
VSRRPLVTAWVMTAVVFGALFTWGLGMWRTLDARGQEAALVRARLVSTIRAKQEELQRETRSPGLLGERLWSTERADPAVILNGLAEMARGTRLKILAIGPLEHKTTPQFVKSWQTIQITSPFADLKDLVARIERDRGFLEDLVLEVPREPARPRAPEAREIQARFKMTSIEVTGDAKRSLQRALAANRTGPGLPLGAEAPSALPLPAKPAEHAGRDPFAFVVAAVAASPKKKPAAAPPVVKPPHPSAVAPSPEPGGMAAASTQQPSSTSSSANQSSAASPLMDVKGIISLPDGYLAIVNKNIVKAGDMVDNHRVEQITATTVVLRRADGESQLLTLPPGSAASSDGANR